MQYSKTSDGKWWLNEYESPEAVLELNNIEFQINLPDIYDRVNFADGEE